MTVRRRITTIAAAVAIIIATVCFCVACDGGVSGESDTYTITFVTNCDTVIPPITGKAGSAVTAPDDPQKPDHVFDGWYEKSDFTGGRATIPSVMPKADVTYYAKFVPYIDPDAGKIRIIYDINLGSVAHGGNVTDTLGEAGEEVTVKNGDDYGARGYKFVGWTTRPTGVVAVSGEKNDGQYNAGDRIKLGDENITLYAQWARGYNDLRGENSAVVYVYSPLIGKGLGSAILVRAGKDDKLGFAAHAENPQFGYTTFTFYMEDSEGGDMIGRLDGGGYICSDEVVGNYKYYDYVFNRDGAFILALDGFGYATLTEIVVSTTAVRAFGSYEYDREYGDYKFTYLDTTTGMPELDDNGEPLVSYFMLEDKEADEAGNRGSFLWQGAESASYMLYDNGELLNYRLDLNGYGSAKMLAYDPVSGTTETVAQGAYRGTEEYDDYTGEWQFDPVGGCAEYACRFILNYVAVGNGQYTRVFIEYNEMYNKTFTSADGETLYLDGYGSAIYTMSSGAVFIGNCKVGDEEKLVTFVPYAESGEYAGEMYFDIDMDTLAFSVNADGFITDGTKLVKYTGKSPIVVIPDGITEIADDVFNYQNTGVSLLSVTVPASVTAIGKRAFENNRSLSRAVFLSSTPIAVDFASEFDPFRWPAGNFVIVVPEADKAAYVSAWADCKYKIKGSVEVTIIPEFEIEDGVLIGYNGVPEGDEQLDVIIPNDVTEIAVGVFRGISYVRSVDLNNVTVIGEGAFESCANLAEVKFTHVTTIGEGAFAGCYLLASSGTADVLELPEIESVGDSAFSSCMSLRRVILGENLKAIGSFAFIECNVDIKAPPLFVELRGATPPEMGEKLAAGNIAFRIEVSDISIALKCFAAPSWNAYSRHLYIPSGEEKGVYYYGLETLEIDGRAMFFNTDIMLYAINGGAVKFYEYDAETATYAVYDGTYADGKISVDLDGKTYLFVRGNGKVSYASADGKYTLVCDPAELQPDNFADTDYTGYADGTLNGKAVKIYVSGYNIKRISGFVDEDGKTYEFDISFDGNTLVYTKKVVGTLNLTAADGSTLTIRVSGNLIFVSGELKIKVGTNADGSDIMMPTFGDGGTLAQRPSENVYTFVRDYRGTKYNITVTVTGESFAYAYTVQ